ncbi:MAG: glycine cleavage system protein GcvH [Eubacteriales bacterium]|nr:glycine cleavage system protein GcvH [Eubacteriales bacterium]
MANTEVKQDLLYTEDHEWVRKLDNDEVEVGITAYAAGELGELVYAEAEPEDTEVDKGDVVASLESVKMAADIYAPCSGTIIEGNEDIEDEPETISNAPYETWLVRLKLSDPADLDELMDAAAYVKMIEEA